MQMSLNNAISVMARNDVPYLRHCVLARHREEQSGLPREGN